VPFLGPAKTRWYHRAMAKNKKPTLEGTARELTAVAEKFLSSFPAEEQDRRVENFEKAAIRRSRAKPCISTKKSTGIFI
jgi:hypothetical protein